MMLLGFLLLTPLPALRSEEPLALRDLPAVLADGRPWSMVASDGKRATLTLRPDGSGTLAGPVRLSIRWRIDGARFCLRMGLLLGTRCVDRFDPVPGGWRGRGARGNGFTLTRA